MIVKIVVPPCESSVFTGFTSVLQLNPSIVMGRPAEDNGPSLPRKQAEPWRLAQAAGDRGAAAQDSSVSARSAALQVFSEHAKPRGLPFAPGRGGLAR